MSDYFGSLLRASGLDASGTTRTPTPASDMPDSAPSMLPPTPAESFELESTTARNPSPQAVPAPQTEPPSPQPPAIHQDTTASLVRRDAEPRPDRAPQPSKITATEPPSALDQDAVPSSQSLLRSTLRWIAADPQAPHRKADSIGTEVSDPHDHQRSPVPHVQATERSSLTVEAEAVASPRREQPHRAEAATPALDHGQLTMRPDHASSVHAAAWHDTDDAAPFDVSIGSIHVRVDAPAPQTVARAVPATSHTRAAPPPSRQRSSLARRALRRL